MEGRPLPSDERVPTLCYPGEETSSKKGVAENALDTGSRISRRVGFFLISNEYVELRSLYQGLCTTWPH